MKIFIDPCLNTSLYKGANKKVGSFPVQEIEQCLLTFKLTNPGIHYLSCLKIYLSPFIILFKKERACLPVNRQNLQDICQGNIKQSPARFPVLKMFYCCVIICHAFPLDSSPKYTPFTPGCQLHLLPLIHSV